MLTDRPPITRPSTASPTTEAAGVAVDALSDLLRAFRVSGSMFFRARLRAPYAVTADGVDEVIRAHAPDALQVIPFHLVTRGPIWFEVEGSEPVYLEDGDIIVLPGGAAHSLMDRLGQPPVPVSELVEFVSGTPETLDWGGDGHQAEALCGFFRLDSRLFNPLLQALPPVLVIPHDEARSSWLTATLERAFVESTDQRAGHSAMIARLTELLFLDVVQRHLDAGAAEGWLAALNDPVVGAALAHLHARPNHPWTLDELARASSASRSSLAERFAARVGVSPMRYLTEWRMELAAQRLEETSDPVGAIAVDAGYESEAAFNRAFKRHTGEPPAAWRRRRIEAARVQAAP